jgi:hypothetical protein
METTHNALPALRFMRKAFRASGLRIISAGIINKDGSALTLYCRNGANKADVTMHLIGKRVCTNIFLYPAEGRPTADTIRITKADTVKKVYKRRKTSMERKGRDPQDILTPVYRAIHAIAKQYEEGEEE